MDLADALYDRLQAAVRATAPRQHPLTIGEIYQRLIPYRAVRAEQGVLEFAAYEHALLRLLAGEGKRLEVRDPHAREELQRELASVNPILGVYRDYADAVVQLLGGNGDEAPGQPAATPAARPAPPAAPPQPGAPRPAPGQPAASRSPSGEPAPAASRTSSAAGSPTANAAPRPPSAPATPPRTPSPPATPPRTPSGQARPAAGAPPARPTQRQQPAPAQPRPDAGPPAPSRPAPGASTPPPASTAKRCRSCRETLPSVDEIRFCPFCGVSQGAEPCATCGTPLEGGWSFCIRCGAGAERSPAR